MNTTSFTRPFMAGVRLSEIFNYYNSCADLGGYIYRLMTSCSLNPYLSNFCSP